MVRRRHGRRGEAGELVEEGRGRKRDWVVVVGGGREEPRGARVSSSTSFELLLLAASASTFWTRHT